MRFDLNGRFFGHLVNIKWHTGKILTRKEALQSLDDERLRSLIEGFTRQEIMKAVQAARKRREPSPLMSAKLWARKNKAAVAVIAALTLMVAVLAAWLIAS